MTQAAVDPLVGTIVDDRYEVTARIAMGGMATVYRAVDRRLDRDVALKIMHPHLAETSDFVARFRREARAAARLTHPGVVGIYDQGSDGDTAYLTMEHVDGPNLRTVLKHGGPLPLGRALSVLEAVLDALAAAHSAGLVHRDVKPENVLIARDGRVKVADFGLAKAVTEATAATTGTLLGTVAYLSPEVVTDGSSDARADVYASGVMLFELITGRQPLAAETAIRTAYRHVHEDVPAPSAHVPWLPVEVDELVAALTARDPAERPADARAALAILRRARLALDEEVLARRADFRPRVQAEAGIDPDATRDLGSVAGSGTVALPIGDPGETLAPSYPPGSAQEPGARLLTGGSRRRRASLLVLLLVGLLGGTATWWWLAGPGAYLAVPDLTGRSEADALSALEALGLEHTRSEAHDDAIPSGSVVTTEPAPGEPVRRAGSVEVVVSLGILMVQVPVVEGLSEAEAVGLLAENGLEADLLRPYHDTVPEGIAIATDPPAGEVIPHFGPLTLSISAGREPVTVPNVVGAERATAEQDLTDAGLVPKIAEDFSENVAQGTVISQEPVPGPAYRNDEVTIVVSLGPPLIEVPNVVGSQVAAARRVLTDLGFAVRVENVLGGFFGTVRATDPGAGTSIPKGSTVVLTVV